MKIGVITFWNSKDNYGQQLQCYAMQKYLEKLGHEPYLIRYDFACGGAGKSWLGQIRKLRKLVLPSTVLRNLEWRIFPREFEKFREKNIIQSVQIYHTAEELKLNVPQAEMYIVGSDQVWHFDKKGNVDDRIHAFMLDFGDAKTIRVAGAASWGVDTLSDTLVQKISPLLAKLNYVTVREHSGVKLCEMCGKDARIVYDPTMYLEADEYRNMYQKAKMRKPMQKYLLVYYINNGGRMPDLGKVYKWAKSRQLSVELITANGVLDIHHKSYVSVEEWLYLIDHAEYVITNSFHGCVFSCLFQKRFAVIRLSGKNESMNTRLDTFFELCNKKPVYLRNMNDLSVLEQESYLQKRIEIREEYMLHAHVKELLI